MAVLWHGRLQHSFGSSGSTGLAVSRCSWPIHRWPPGSRGSPTDQEHDCRQDVCHDLREMGVGQNLQKDQNLDGFPGYDGHQGTGEVGVLQVFNDPRDVGRTLGKVTGPSLSRGIFRSKADRSCPRAQGPGGQHGEDSRYGILGEHGDIPPVADLNWEIEGPGTSTGTETSISYGGTTDPAAIMSSGS